MVDGKEMDAVNGVRTRPGDPTPVNFDLQKLAQAESASRQAADAEGHARPASSSKEQERGMTQGAEGGLEKAHQRARSQMKKNKELNDSFNAGMTAMQNKQYDAAVASLHQGQRSWIPTQMAVWAQLGEAHVKLARRKDRRRSSTPTSARASRPIPRRSS